MALTNLVSAIWCIRSLPSRDYADSSYYRGNIRNHTTAAVAFLYSYSTPKLRIQGADGEAGAAETSGGLADLPCGEKRTFYNSDRTKSFDGRLVVFDPAVGLVRVRLENGKMIDFEFLTLSKEDQEYVKENGAGVKQ